MTDSKNTPALKKFKILLIGDSCVDEYYIGTCDRLNPEAPVPIINVKERYKTPGMAANVNENFKKLGLFVEFITNDSKIIKKRYIDKRSGQHLLRVDEEPNTKLWDAQRIFPTGFYDCVVISDYNKGFLNYELIEMLETKFDCPIFLDTKKTDIGRFKKSFIKINLLEYSKIISQPKNLDKLIITNGENGAMLNTKHFSAPKVEVVDVCGAGDTFLSSLVFGYLTFDKDIDKAIQFANVSASLTVQHRGNYAPSYSQIISHQEQICQTLK